MTDGATNQEDDRLTNVYLPFPVWWIAGVMHDLLVCCLKCCCVLHFRATVVFTWLHILSSHARIWIWSCMACGDELCCVKEHQHVIRWMFEGVFTSLCFDYGFRNWMIENWQNKVLLSTSAVLFSSPILISSHFLFSSSPVLLSSPLLLYSPPHVLSPLVSVALWEMGMQHLWNLGQCQCLK